MKQEQASATLGDRAFSNTSGAAAVEFALLVPVLILFLFGIIECGRILWTENALQFAVERAARCAAINTTTCGNAVQIQTYAATQMYGQSVSSSIFSSSSASCGNLVTASLPFTALVISVNVTLTAKSCRPS